MLLRAPDDETELFGDSCGMTDEVVGTAKYDEDDVE